MLERRLLPILLVSAGCASTVIPQWPDGDVLAIAADSSRTIDAAADTGPPGRTTWTPGWDRFNEPFDLATSNVSFSVSAGTLTVQYALRGAVPGRRYGLGLHLFRDAAVPCDPSFGGHPGTGCSTATRQGVTRAYAAYDADRVTIAADGTVTATVVYSPIAHGTYVLEFHTRDDCAAFPGCDVVLQSPGPWGVGTLSVNVP